MLATDSHMMRSYLRQKASPLLSAMQLQPPVSSQANAFLAPVPRCLCRLLPLADEVGNVVVVVEICGVWHVHLQQRAAACAGCARWRDGGRKVLVSCTPVRYCRPGSSRRAAAGVRAQLAPARRFGGSGARPACRALNRTRGLEQLVGQGAAMDPHLRRHLRHSAPPSANRHWRRCCTRRPSRTQALQQAPPQDQRGHQRRAPTTTAARCAACTWSSNDLSLPAAATRAVVSGANGSEMAT
jgi:hypothetical protein